MRHSRREDHLAEVARQGEAVPCGVADESSERARTMLGEDRVNQFLTAAECFLPGDFVPVVAVADHRRAQPIRVLVEVSDR